MLQLSSFIHTDARNHHARDSSSHIQTQQVAHISYTPQTNDQFRPASHTPVIHPSTYVRNAKTSKCQERKGKGPHAQYPNADMYAVCGMRNAGSRKENVQTPILVPMRVFASIRVLPQVAVHGGNAGRGNLEPR